MELDVVRSCEVLRYSFPSAQKIFGSGGEEGYMCQVVFYQLEPDV